MAPKFACLPASRQRRFLAFTEATERWDGAGGRSGWTAEFSLFLCCATQCYMRLFVSNGSTTILWWVLFCISDCWLLDAWHCCSCCCCHPNQTGLGMNERLTATAFLQKRSPPEAVRREVMTANCSSSLWFLQSQQDVRHYLQWHYLSVTSWAIELRG